MKDTPTEAAPSAVYMKQHEHKFAEVLLVQDVHAVHWNNCNVSAANVCVHNDLQVITMHAMIRTPAKSCPSTKLVFQTKIHAVVSDTH